MDFVPADTGVQLVYPSSYGLRHTVKPLFNGHFGTSKVSLRKEVAFIERSILYTAAVVGTCIVSIIERLSIAESAR